jgi:tripartite-type tricarboxylate transporter receptor subunit TctC
VNGIVRQLLILIAYVTISMVSTAGIAIAQNFPEKPIKLIVPFPPGGGTDLIARELAQALNKTAGWTVIAENRPGAGGNLGVDAAVKSTPDGYTIVLGQTSNLAINPTLYPKLSYQPSKDLAPVALIASAPLVIVVGAGSAYQSLKELIEKSRIKVNSLNFASPGNGTVAHLAGELLQSAGKFKAQHIPYKGFNIALSDVISGQVDMYMSSVPTIIGQIRTGKLRALAVTSIVRTDELPEIPTVAELGYPNFSATTWFGIAAPANTPSDRLEILNREINCAIQTPEFIKKIKHEGGTVLGGIEKMMFDFIAIETDKWGAIVKESGATID